MSEADHHNPHENKEIGMRTPSKVIVLVALLFPFVMGMVLAI